MTIYLDAAVQAADILDLVEDVDTAVDTLIVDLGFDAALLAIAAADHPLSGVAMASAASILYCDAEGL